MTGIILVDTSGTDHAIWTGTDSFSYTLTDAYGQTATATVSVTDGPPKGGRA